MERIINDEIRLTLNEAKELYTQAMDTTDLELRKLYLDKIVLGTLYVVKKYLKSNNYKMFESASIGFEDIESAFIEQWIKTIYSGEFMKYDHYSYIFNVGFHNAAFCVMGVQNIPVFKFFNIDVGTFIDLFLIYVDMRNNYRDISYGSFVKEIKDREQVVKLKYSFVSYLFEVMETIYNKMNIDPLEGVSITKTHVVKCFKLMVYNGLFDSLTEDYQDKDIADEVLTKMFYDSFIDDVFKLSYNERAKEMLKSRVGFDDDKERTLDEVGEIFGTTRSRTGQILQKTIRILLNDSRIRAYNEIFNSNNNDELDLRVLYKL